MDMIRDNEEEQPYAQSKTAENVQMWRERAAAAGAASGAASGNASSVAAPSNGVSIKGLSPFPSFRPIVRMPNMNAGLLAPLTPSPLVGRSNCGTNAQGRAAEERYYGY